MTVADDAAAAFRQQYGTEPTGLWAAPGRVNLIGGTGHNLNACFLRKLPRGRFIAQHFQQFGAWPHKRDAGAFAGFRQRRVFRQKTVAGVDKIDFFFRCQRHNRIHVQVSLHRAFALPHQIRFVGFKPMQA